VNRKLPLKEAQGRKNPGLGVVLGASNADVERALEIARDAHDAKVMRDLRARLNELMKRPGARVLTREKALSLLRLVRDGLRPATEVPVDTTGSGEIIVVDHSAIALLEELIDALSDLNRGHLGDLFRVSRKRGAPPLSIKQRKRDQVLLDSVIIVKNWKGYKTLAEAENYMVRRWRQAGYTLDGTTTGELISRPLIRRLRSNSRTRKPLEVP
jgi:hypothetical protein